MVQGSDQNTQQILNQEGMKKVTFDGELTYGYKCLNFRITQIFATEQELLTVFRLQEKK